MKTTKKFTILLFIIGISMLISAKKVLADMAPIGGWPLRNPNSGKSFIELMGSQPLILGGAIILGTTLSFVVLYKIRNK